MAKQTLWNDILNVHKGNQGLPDFGLSEFVGRILAPQGTTYNVASGGSDLFDTKQGGQVLSAQTGGPSANSWGGYGSEQAQIAANNAARGTQTTSNTKIPNPVTTTGGGGRGGGQPDLNQQVNDVYNPINDFLNQMAQEYEAGRAPAEANIQSSFDRQLTPINEKAQTELGIQNTQEGNVNREEANALAQARQVYNELQQRNVATYGTGSSAGPAANELLGRSTARQFGAIGESATGGRTSIEAERGNIKKFAEQKRVDLNSQKEEAIRSLQTEFRSGLLQINQMKAQNESAKASARLDLLQRAQEQANQIEQADKAYQRAIDQFARESAVTSQANSQFSSLRGTDSATANQFSQILANPAYSTAQKYVQGIQLGIDPKLVGSIITQSAKDKQDELANPFATPGQ